MSLGCPARSRRRSGGFVAPKIARELIEQMYSARAEIISIASASERGFRDLLIAGATLATARGTDSVRNPAANV